jgi:hypothetical protein
MVSRRKRKFCGSAAAPDAGVVCKLPRVNPWQWIVLRRDWMDDCPDDGFQEVTGISRMRAFCICVGINFCELAMQFEMLPVTHHR